MTELFDFARALIELEGGASDVASDELVALLPPAVSARWQVPEEFALSEHPHARHRLAYGTELLERMIDTAVSRLCVVSVELDIPPPKEGQLRGAATQFALRNGVVEVRSLRVGPQLRVELQALATLQGDEQRELIVPAVVSAFSNTEVPGFAEASAPLCAQRVDSQPIALCDDTLHAALSACGRRAEVLAAPFRDSMARRYERDRGRIEGYFEDLERELQKRAARGKLEQAAVSAKRAALDADKSAKLEALLARFVLRIAVEPIALRLHHVQGGFVSLLLRRRKQSRVIELEYDGLTRRIVAPRCDSCGRGTQRPGACDDALHLLCETCAPRSEGRLACGACKSVGSRSKNVA